MNQLMLATANRGKILEFKTMLAPLSCQSMLDLSIDSPEETGLTFIENALIKARHASLKAGLPALSDDSGLVVPALGGEPGIHSARYAGTGANSHDNIKKLLDELSFFESVDRVAYFYTVLVLMKHPEDPAPIIATGRLDGEIAFMPKGSGGFGYDPVFYLKSHDCTLAELSLDEKNKLSHRAKALLQLKEYLQ